MGFGDELMVTGQAKASQQRVNLPVVVFDRNGKIRMHELWYRNPRITHTWDRKSPVSIINNGPGVRPYIESKTESRWTWKNFECTPGEIFFYEAEKQAALQFPSDGIVIEPGVKQKASPNKDWGWDRWQAFAVRARRSGLRLIQLGPSGTRILNGVEHYLTNTFREACAALARSRAAVLHEGGLHHAAAAVNVNAVVIYGGFISPLQTGYQTHRNLFTGGEACGMRYTCKHCAKAMAEITPELLEVSLMGVLNA